ncbi:MAG: UDP-N-acetylmuramate--L-alanine ligase [Deltaproteobacteria bacterium]|nr:UDP-N-acetylmuramate--L-alanine ligase [Deltaproteobacteria bacterium]
MYNPKLHFHFTGIGGSGMSGIAEILLNLGFRVSGSDVKISPTCERLQKLGASILPGHSAENVPEGISLLVYSSAVARDNPELLEAKRRGLPVIPRAAVLAELMRLKYGVAVAGSHGKTTTTSMTAAVMEHGGLDPTIIIGGQVKATGSGGKLGKGDFLVAESDESDRSFLLLKPTIAVVTNIDSEHLNAYSSQEDLENSFEQFVASVPFYGLAILCLDDPKVRVLASRYSGRKVTYGVSADAQIQARNLHYKKFLTSFDVYRDGEYLLHVDLPMLGSHIALNSLAAVAVGLEFGLSPRVIEEALASFSGVKRRLEIVGEVRGITVMNDYGHHPTEVAATLAAVKSGFGADLNRLHVIFQPHRYTRTRDCFNDFIPAFKDCDNLLLTDIYAASEEPIVGIHSEALCAAIRHPSKQYVAQLEETLPILVAQASAGDVVLCLGAGSVGTLPERLIAEFSKKVAA